MKRRRYTYISFVLLVMLTFAAIMSSYAWVNNNKKAKIEQEEVKIEGVDNLLISLNDGLTYFSSIDATDANKSKYANFLQDLTMKDYTGDGINLYSPIVDPYTKLPQSGGWQVIRTQQDDFFDSVKIQTLNEKNENRNYYSLEVYFQANVYMDIYLSRNSYVLPSVSGMGNNQVLLLQRKATFNLDDNNSVVYTYYTENGYLGTNLTNSQLPAVFNQSLYCYAFNDARDEEALNEYIASYREANEGADPTGEWSNTQSRFSANYVAGAVRVAFIDEEKTGGYTSQSVSVGADGHGNYDNSRLRMIWAPNPNYQSSVVYKDSTNSWSYGFDIKDTVRTEAGYEVDNKYYLVNNSTLVQTDLLRFPKDIFCSNLDDGYDTVSTYESAISNNLSYDYKPHKLVTLTDGDGDGIYTAKIRVIMWIEGTDIEANASLTGGSLSSNNTNNTEGSAKIKFLLSFFGYQKPEPGASTNP